MSRVISILCDEYKDVYLARCLLAYLHGRPKKHGAFRRKIDLVRALSSNTISKHAVSKAHYLFWKRCELERLIAWRDNDE